MSMDVEEVSMVMIHEKRDIDEVDKENQLPKTKKRRAVKIDKVEEEVDESKRKEEERKRKELIKFEKEKQKEREKQEREQKKEEEKLQREKKKEEERLEKERKREKERTERERKKEEEKLEKEKRKEAREKERLEKKLKLEEEKKAKEEERKRMEEEKKKIEEAKSKGQKKISNFFKFSGSLSPSKSTQAISKSTDANLNNQSLYEQKFLPFFVQENVTVIENKIPNFMESKQELEEFINNPDKSRNSNYKEYLQSKRMKTLHQHSIISPDEIIDALNSSTTTETHIHSLFKSIPSIKFISFYENSKPPYVGTWCSKQHLDQTEELIKNPLNTSLTGLDYDYDSDLEWNKEDEEGEDLDNEEDEEDEDIIIEDEEDEEFVEKDTDNVHKKKFINLQIVTKLNNDENKDHFQNYTCVKLVQGDEVVDPFHNYWNVTQSNAINNDAQIKQSPSNNVTEILNNKLSGTTSSPNILVAQKKTIKDENAISKLITFIEKNNDFTIGTLVDLSRKEDVIKDFTKALIKNTIQHLATYNKKDQKWEIKK